MQELYHFPEQITSEVLTSIVQAIEFLTALLKVKDLPGVKDPATGTGVRGRRRLRDARVHHHGDGSGDGADPFLSRARRRRSASLANTPCDLIILDVQMPGMDGFELCSQIRQHTMHKHTPVAFVTGQTGAEVRRAMRPLRRHGFPDASLSSWRS